MLQAMKVAVAEAVVAVRPPAAPELNPAFSLKGTFHFKHISVASHSAYPLLTRGRRPCQHAITQFLGLCMRLCYAACSSFYKGV